MYTYARLVSRSADPVLFTMTRIILRSSQLYFGYSSAPVCVCVGGVGWGKLGEGAGGWGEGKG